MDERSLLHSGIVSTLWDNSGIHVTYREMVRSQSFENWSFRSNCFLQRHGILLIYYPDELYKLYFYLIYLTLSANY